MALQFAPPENAVFTRRSRPRMLLLDAEMRVVLAEPEALALLSPRLTAKNENAFVVTPEFRAYLMQQLQAAGSEHDWITTIGEVVLRLCPAQGTLGTFTLAFVERFAQREDLPHVMRRYGFTAREVEVFRLVLIGQRASEIAAVLNITKNTVDGYFRSLLQKTGAKNRSEMVALVLGWQQTSQRAHAHPALVRARIRG